MDGQLLPPEAQAANVEQALKILALGDERLPEADRYLAQIRVSRTIWPVLHFLIHSPASHPALSFAARTLHTRLRSDWLAFDDAARAAAFSLAVDGALRCSGVAGDSASPVYFFGRAAGFAVSHSHVDVRDAMWQALQENILDPVLRCQVLAAVVDEVGETSTRDVEKHVETRAFCRKKAADIIPVAISLLQPSRASSDADIVRLRAGVNCLHAWCLYGEKLDMATALMRVLVIPQVADDASETLNEIVGYSGTSLGLLLSICDGLIAAYRAIEGVAANVVHHAISEIACALSEGNADELMEQESEESRLVVSRVSELLWLCLKSSDDRSFFAAAEGWGSWIAAQNLVGESQRKLGSTQIAALVGVVVQRMKTLQFVEASVWPGEGDASDFADERGCVTDLLLESATSIGVGEYVGVVTPMFTSQCDQSPPAICAALLALSIAGDTPESGLLRRDVQEVLLGMLERIVDLLESCTSSTNGGGKEPACIAVRVAALKTLSCYSMVLSTHASDSMFYRVVRCAGTGMLDKGMSEHAAHLLCELADGNAKRLIGFLHELISSVKETLHGIPVRAAEECVRGLARVAAALASHEGRLKAMEGLLSEMCERVRWTCAERKVSEHEPTVCRDIALITVALHEMNDNEAARTIFERLRPAIFEISAEHCGNHEVSRVICRLLEVCVIPTLMDDDGEDVRKRTEGGRLVLAISCAELAGECFRRSGPNGETCWLKAMHDVSAHMLWGVECAAAGLEASAVRCLSGCVGRVLEGMQEFCVAGYDTQPEMTVAYFRLANQLVSRIGHALVTHASGLTEVALGSLRCTNVSIVRESLAFWKLTFAPSTRPEVGQAMLKAGGGPASVTAGVLCAAQMSRCAGGVADALYAMCRAVGGGEDVGALLQELLTKAFEVEGVPRAGLDRGVREMLFRGCYCSAGSKREFRRALDEVGRVCAMAIR